MFHPSQPKSKILLEEEFVNQVQKIAADKSDQDHDLMIKHIFDVTKSTNFHRYEAPIGVRNLFGGK